MPRLRRVNRLCSSMVSGTADSSGQGSTLCSPTVEKSPLPYPFSERSPVSGLLQAKKQRETGVKRVETAGVYPLAPSGQRIDNEKATENTFRWLFSLLVQIETLLEAINTSAGVYQLLLTREEGVALGANVNDDILLGGAGLNDIAAGTADRGLLVVGMDALFHVVSPLSTDMFTYLQQS